MTTTTKKNQHNVKLHGIMANGHVAKTSDAFKVTVFVSHDRIYSFVLLADRAFLRTTKGHYQLTKHKSANRYQGMVRNIKVHVIAKVIAGKLIYWV
jgi:hypothetical protein